MKSIFLFSTIIAASAIFSFIIMSDNTLAQETVLNEQWTGIDGASWPSQWQINATLATANISGNMGRMATITTGSYTAPIILAKVPSINFTSVDFKLYTQYVSGSVLNIRAFAGSQAPITVTLGSDGTYNVYKGGTLIIDARSVGNRPPLYGSGPHWIRLKIERNYGGTDIYTKVWPGSAQEPISWHKIWWQDTDPVLFNAQGPVELEVCCRGTDWLVNDLTAVQIPAASPLPKTSPIMHTDATDDFHIPYNNGQDVSLIIPQALSQLPPGSTVYFEPGATYQIEQEVKLSDIRDITLVGQTDAGGQKTIFKRSMLGDRTVPYVRCENCVNVTIKNFEIAGPEQQITYSNSVEFAAGVIVSGGQNIAIRDMFIHNVGGDAVQISGVARNVSVINVQANHTRRQGMSANNFDTVLFDNVTIEWTGRTGIDIEPYAADWIAYNTIIRNVKMRHIRNWGIGAISIPNNTKNMTIEDVDITGGIGFATLAGSGIVVQRNTYDWRDSYDILINRGGFSVKANDVVYVGNNIMKTANDGPVIIHGTGGTIENNTFVSGDLGDPIPYRRDTLNYSCSMVQRDNTLIALYPPGAVGKLTCIGSNISLAANPASVTAGGSITLTWSSNTDSCAASGGWSGTKATSGSEVITGLTSPTTFTLNCTSSSGIAVTSVTVSVYTSPASLQESLARLLGNIITDGPNITVNIPINFYDKTLNTFTFRKPSAWLNMINFAINESTASITTQNNTHITLTVDPNKIVSLLFDIPAPKKTIDMETITNATFYRKEITISSNNPLSNVSATIPINSTYQYYKLYELQGSSWVDVTTSYKFTPNTAATTATFYGFSLSDKQFRIEGSTTPTPYTYPSPSEPAPSPSPTLSPSYSSPYSTPSGGPVDTGTSPTITPITNPPDEIKPIAVSQTTGDVSLKLAVPNTVESGDMYTATVTLISPIRKSYTLTIGSINKEVELDPNKPETLELTLRAPDNTGNFTLVASIGGTTRSETINLKYLPLVLSVNESKSGNETIIDVSVKNYEPLSTELRIIKDGKSDVFIELIEGQKEYKRQLKLTQPGEYKVIATATSQQGTVDTDEYSLTIEGKKQFNFGLMMIIIFAFVMIVLVLTFAFR